MVKILEIFEFFFSTGFLLDEDILMSETFGEYVYSLENKFLVISVVIFDNSHNDVESAPYFPEQSLKHQ